MNKYRPGGRCGGDSKGDTKCNPEFNSSLANLMAQRDKQDAIFFSPSSSQGTADSAPLIADKKEKPLAKSQLVITETTNKPKKEAYIQLLLEGDYEP
jgi:hypothetical protein